MNKFEVAADVIAIQTPVLEAAKNHFAESKMTHLACLLRLNVEFFHFHFDSDQPHSAFEIEYRVDSILSGVESFVAVRDTYGSIDGARPTAVSWEGFSIDTLLESFRSGYTEFLREADFMRKCRLLLDLFKMQIVFAGYSSS